MACDTTPLAPEEETALRAFLRDVELALLSVESDTPAPKIPVSLPAVLRVECEALTELLLPASCGDVAAILASPWLSPLAPALAHEAAEQTIRAGGLDALAFALASSCEAFVARDGANSAVRGVGLLTLAVAALKLYMRVNWTGPPFEPGDDGEALAALPFDPAGFAEGAVGGEELMRALEVDGEMPYELLCGPGYLWLAAWLLGTFRDGCCRTAAAKTVAVWRGRSAFTWQLSLDEASERGTGQSPWLFKLAVADLVDDGSADGVREGVPFAGDGLLAGKTLAAVQAMTRPWLITMRELSSVANAGHASEEGARLAVDDGTGAHWSGPCVLSEAPEPVRAALVAEFCSRLCWYGRDKPYEHVLQAACDPIGFTFELTGMPGIKRKWQTVEYAQLVLKASSTRGVATRVQPEKEPDDSAKGYPGGTVAPTNITMVDVDFMNDVLEAPKITGITDEERRLIETPLTAAEQLILLLKCQHIWATNNSFDHLMLTEINAVANRIVQTEEKIVVGQEEKALETVLESEAGKEGVSKAKNCDTKTANWLTYSCGLWYRSRSEHHRTKTRDRAAYQLQSLVDQYNDVGPSAGHRLLLVHGAGFPARFQLQREYGERMMKMGMVSTAHEEFKRLRMWPEAIDCLMIAERNCEALDMVKDLLEKAPTPRLWCCLGDLEENPAHYEKAWQLSKCRFARAQRSLGRYFFQQDEKEKAVEAFQLALAINPLHAAVWFTMGCSLMILQRYDEAVKAFVRSVGVDEENGEAWGNLASAQFSCKKYKEARAASVEACKRCYEHWKMWDSFLMICFQLRDVTGCIQAMRRLVEIGVHTRIPERVLGMLTVAVVNNNDGLYNGKTGRTFLGQMNDFFVFLTEKVATEARYWRFYAHIQDVRGEIGEALESRLRQCRCAQGKLWEETDPESFTTQLAELHECLDLVDDMLCKPGAARDTMQPFAYLVRNVASQLQAKLDTGVSGEAEAGWQKELPGILSIASRAEARAAEAYTPADKASNPTAGELGEQNEVAPGVAEQ